MLDLKESLRKKANELVSNAKVLNTILINWEAPIQIKCSDLLSKPAIEEKDYFKNLKKLSKHPVIYYFKIKSQHNSNLILNSLRKYKEENKRSCPKIDDKRNKESIFLYCGSIKKGLQDRFIQHLGFGSEHTYALQLCHWAKEQNLELEFHYAKLDVEYKDFTELVESALADKIEPLVGKIALT